MSLPGALLHGAALLAAGDLRPQTLSPLGPRSPSAPGSPYSGKKIDAISHLAAALGTPLLLLSPVTAQLTTLSPAQWPGLPCSFLPSHVPSVPWVQRGRAHPGSPSGCPPPHLPVGRVQAGLAPRGPQEGLPRVTALPKPPCQGTGCGHPSPEVQAGTPWGRSPTLGPGGPGGPGKPSLPWPGEINRLSIKGT